MGAVEGGVEHAAPAGGIGDLDAAWFADALYDAADLFLAVETDGTIRWSSAAARHLLGVDPQELVGTSLVELVHLDDLARALEVRHLAAAHDASAPWDPAICRLRHADGSWIPLDVNVAPGPDGGLVLVIRPNRDLVLEDRLLELVTSDAPFAEQLDVVLELARWRFAHHGLAVVFRTGGGDLTAHAAGIPDLRLVGALTPPGPTPWGVAAQRGTGVVCTDLGDRTLLGEELAELAARAGFWGYIAVPTTDPAHPDGACLLVWAADGEQLSDDDRRTGGSSATEVLERGARALTLILAWRDQRRRLERAAGVDPLTGLASRARFFALAQQRLEGAAALYVAIDGLEGVRDRYGLGAGDEVLRTVASRCTAIVDPGALVARIGGDGFVALLPAGTVDQAMLTAQALVDAVRLPIPVSGGVATVEASVGLSFHRGGDDVDRLIDRADGAVLAVEAEGSGGWQIAADDARGRGRVRSAAR